MNTFCEDLISVGADNRFIIKAEELSENICDALNDYYRDISCGIRKEAYMRFEITGQWKNSAQNDGMLYCAQRIEEMLMVYTSHLYKVPVYNTFLLASEFMHVYNDVEKRSIDQAHLKNVMEEFIASFGSDIVIKEHFDVGQIHYFTTRLTGSSIFDQRRTMHYLIHVMMDYPNWCVDTLKKAVKDPKGKKKIEKALRSYVPMIIGLGYNPHYIYRECKNAFTKQDIDNTSALDNFLKLFNGVENKYIVYFAVDKIVLKFKTILEERLRLSFEEDEYSGKLHYDSSKQICVHRTEMALDPNGAAQRAYYTFDLFMRYYRFLGNRDRDWVGNKCLVKDMAGECSFPHIGADRYFYSKDYDAKTLGNNSERIITQLLENAGGNDFLKIDKIIRTHNTALSSQEINNAFLNLWSIMEIVGVDGYGGETSKIKQILNNIVPVLKRNYVNRILEELHDYLKGNIETDNYTALIKEVSEEGSEVYKIACLVSLQKYEETRKKAYALLTEYPLIRSRISQLYEDVFKKKKKLLLELNRYEQRIVWHIQRLYRVRNSIIHSGNQNENMVSLVEHLHSYVDELILDLINRMTCSQSLGTVANVLLDAQVFIENINKQFNSDDGFTSDDIIMLLQ